ncbi:SPASM domain-containing protein [uncultured Gammaproteobacteria bacterium]
MTDYRKAAWVDPVWNWQPLPVKPLPERLLIDYATRCNLRCPMCTVWGSKDEAAIDTLKGVMDAARSLALLDQVMPAKPLIQPNMYGEPLLIPDLKERIKEIKARGMAIAFNTNGLTLTEKIAAFVVESEVDSVFFSIDAVKPETFKRIRGVDQLSKVEAAVHRMLAARADAVSPRIGVSFTLQDCNQDEEAAFVARWAGLVDCVRIGLIFEDGKFTSLKAPAERKPCPTLYNTLPVHNDGAVTICCLDGFKATVVGNIFESSVKEVWLGEEFSKVRYYHETGQWDKVPFCTDCNGWAQYEFQDEVRNGLLIRRSPEFTYYNRLDRLKNWHPHLRGGHEVEIEMIDLGQMGLA